MADIAAAKYSTNLLCEIFMQRSSVNNAKPKTVSNSETVNAIVPRSGLSRSMTMGAYSR